LRHEARRANDAEPGRAVGFGLQQRLVGAVLRPRENTLRIEAEIRQQGFDRGPIADRGPSPNSAA
jgi:hypothetical protein